MKIVSYSFSRIIWDDVCNFHTQMVKFRQMCLSPFSLISSDLLSVRGPRHNPQKILSSLHQNFLVFSIKLKLDPSIDSHISLHTPYKQIKGFNFNQIGVLKFQVQVIAPRTLQSCKIGETVLCRWGNVIVLRDITLWQLAPEVEHQNFIPCPMFYRNRCNSDTIA